MTTAAAAKDIAAQLEEQFPGSVAAAEGEAVTVKASALPDVARYLRDTAGLAYDYLNYVTAVDYYTHFEVVYRLTSLAQNTTVVLKVRCEGRDNPSVPSVTGIWQGADFQERETYDLLGISFEGHPNLRRILLWEGFDGHPLRKDFNR